MTSKRERSTSKNIDASRRSKRTKTQVEETNDKHESSGYLDVLADQAGVIEENEVVSSQKQQDDALEAKEASEVDEDDSSQEQTESGHASKADDKTEEENDENVPSTSAEASSSGRDPSTTFIEIVVKNISVLCARDIGKNISSDWIKLFADYEAFNAYPWGQESFKLTIEYLLRELKPNVKTINQYCFPWLSW
ncbi:hypothetical protein HAX54_003608 [Datura stramonium]|uniref:DUF1985 domain-containing protein n=1 Tax=Datura stramonium TaxID=4076 RepID=A0ABS8WUW9_DATST|nr:hypothetical protein [Datura stramonium]